jgi:cytochrome P450
MTALLFSLIGPKPTDKSGPGAIHGYAYRQVAARIDKNGTAESRRDILTWIMEHQDKEGERLSREMLEQEAIGPVIAGSDTTSATLRSMILEIASTPRILNRLRQEIDAADVQGLLSTPPTWEQLSKHIPYLVPLFKETQRVYPIVAGILPRSVPKPGVYLDNHFIPAGTDVAISQWGTGHNPDIWGAEDVALFRPERWEEIPPTEEAKKLRDSSEFWFSQGTMMCTGRNVAVLEVYKMIAQFFRMFDVEIVNTSRPWKDYASMPYLQYDMMVRLTERKRD